MNEGVHVKPKEHVVEPIHLNQGIKPIYAYIIGPKDFDGKHEYTKLKYGLTQRFLPKEVNLYGQSSYKKESLLTGGDGAYVFSPINTEDKFSEKLLDCTSIIVSGETQAGDTVSFLTHQNPKLFLSLKREDFIKDLTTRLEEIKELCLPGTIDAIIVGGNYFSKKVIEKKINKKIADVPYKENYLKSIRLISDQVEKILKFKPTIVNGPKTTTGSDEIFYKNAEKILYFKRPQINQNTKDVNISNVKIEKKKWGK